MMPLGESDQSCVTATSAGQSRSKARRMPEIALTLLRQDLSVRFRLSCESRCARIRCWSP
jgi:hypothetical protein